MADVWNALSDPTRRKILELLSADDMTAGEIADNFNITKPSISHHLSILKNTNLISGEKSGQKIIYSINTTVFQDLMRMFAKFMESKEGEKSL